MGCCHSLSILNDCFQIHHSASSGMTNNRSAAMSINGDTDDTVPLTSSKKKNSSRDLIRNDENFSRIIPLLEPRDPNSTFENVEDSRRFSSYTNKSDSSSSIASLENGLSNTIKENAFLEQDIQNENSDIDQNISQNTSINNTINNQINNDQANSINLYNPDDINISTEDEGGISGEMDSSNDDDS